MVNKPNLDLLICLYPRIMSGAEKVVLETSAIKDPKLIREIADVFGN